MTTPHLETLPPSDNPYKDFRYFYRDGMPLRPAPKRRTEKPSWSTARHTLFDKWHRVRDDWSYDTPQTRLLDDHMWQTDEYGNQVAEMFRRVGAKKARADFELALNEGIDKVENPEPEFVALFEQLDNIPEWIDLEAAERGRVAYYNVTRMAEKITFAFGYWATTLEDRTSSATGETQMFEINPLQRGIETANFFVNLGLHGVFDRFSEGFKSAARVRLIHAQANRGLDKLWGPERYNEYSWPINSSHMISGEGWFALVPLAIDEFFGREHSGKEWDDVAMYWAYVLYVMGGEERIIPKTGDEMRKMTDFLFANGGQSSKYRVQVATSLMNIYEMMGERAALEALAGVSLIVGDEDTRFMVKDTKWETWDWSEVTKEMEAQGRAEAAELKKLDESPDAPQRLAQRVKEGNPPWMGALRSKIQWAKDNGIDIPKNYQLHDDSVVAHN